MKKIKLTQGKYALVDNDWFEYLNQWKWHTKSIKSGLFYATRCEYSQITKKRITILMHREILFIKNKSIFVDHINRDGLNNTTKNLRLATRSQNAINCKGTNASSTGVRGVTLAENGKYRVRIKKDGVIHNIGRFCTLLEAKRARDIAAKSIHGQFAYVTQ